MQNPREPDPRITRAIDALRVVALQAPEGSPLHQLLTDELYRWLTARAMGGKDANVIGALHQATKANDVLRLQLEAQANRAAMLSAQLKAAKPSPAPDASRWVLPAGHVRVVLQDVKQNIKTAAQDVADMALTFAVHTMTTSAILYRAFEAALKGGFDGRLIGTPTRLTALDLRQVVSSQERQLFGATVCGIVQVGVRVALSQAVRA